MHLLRSFWFRPAKGELLSTLFGQIIATLKDLGETEYKISFEFSSNPRGKVDGVARIIKQFPELEKYRILAQHSADEFLPCLTNFDKEWEELSTPPKLKRCYEQADPGLLFQIVNKIPRAFPVYCQFAFEHIKSLESGAQFPRKFIKGIGIDHLDMGKFPYYFNPCIFIAYGPWKQAAISIPTPTANALPIEEISPAVTRVFAPLGKCIDDKIFVCPDEKECRNAISSQLKAFTFLRKKFNKNYFSRLVNNLPGTLPQNPNEHYKSIFENSTQGRLVSIVKPLKEAFKPFGFRRMIRETQRYFLIQATSRNNILAVTFEWTSTGRYLDSALFLFGPYWTVGISIPSAGRYRFLQYQVLTEDLLFQFLSNTKHILKIYLDEVIPTIEGKFSSAPAWWPKTFDSIPRRAYRLQEFKPDPSMRKE